MLFAARTAPLHDATRRSQSGRAGLPAITPVPRAPARKPACACGGSCPACRDGRLIQTRLTISHPGDRFEQEADRVADAVMQMPEPRGLAPGADAARLQRQAGAARDEEFVQRQGEEEEEEEEELLQRQPEDEEEELLQRQAEEEEEEELLQTKPAAGAQWAARANLARGMNGVRTGGEPLSAASRSFFEPRFGHDLSHVRIHTDARAASLARSANAKAFTLGRDIVFGAGHFSPASTEGRRLIAHELTHVVQQQSGTVGRAVLQRDEEEEGRRASGGEVRLSYSGRCASPRKIALAVFVANRMVTRALESFLYATSDRLMRRRVNRLLRAHFNSASRGTRTAVLRRLLSISSFLGKARNAEVRFDCSTRQDPGCKSFMGYVTPGERNLVHICPSFFSAPTQEARNWNMVHEMAHLAGARGAERYQMIFGPVTEDICAAGTELGRRAALANADSYAFFVWCLTRTAGTEVHPPEST